jgi:GntR family transcriptional repressor for pyruvate dehydrogenase complex
VDDLNLVEPRGIGDLSVRAVLRPASARPKLATVVREGILAEILAGRWRPGDRVPTEKELMTRFGVSRTPIREAMQSLKLVGIVDISPRRGATVRALSIESVVDLAILSGVMSPRRSLGDVFEFRFAMEGAIAGLAAVNVSRDQVESLQSILAENEAAIRRGDLGAALQVDVRFHAAIAEASGNVVFQAVAHALNGLLVEQRRITSGIAGAPQASFLEHQDILAAIARGDGRSARAAAETHIDRTRARFDSARDLARRPSRRNAASPSGVEPTRGTSQRRVL